MAAGGQGWFAAGYFGANHWNTEYWNENAVSSFGVIAVTLFKIEQRLATFTMQGGGS